MVTVVDCPEPRKTDAGDGAQFDTLPVCEQVRAKFSVT
jgi:hypothetical protein